MTRFLFSPFLSILILAVGCNFPSELRNLVPVTVTVTDGEEPLAGVVVSLSGDLMGPVWSSKGTTNVRGTAKIVSELRTYSAPGTPAGEYKIVIMQMVELPDNLKPDRIEMAGTPASPDVRRKRDAYIKERMVVPDKLSNAETSPIEVTVEPGKTLALTVDIAEYR